MKQENKKAITKLYKKYPQLFSEHILFFNSELDKSISDIKQFVINGKDAFLPYTTDYIINNSRSINFQHLSSNTKLKKVNPYIYSNYLLKGKWDWKYLSGNKSLPWSVSFIENI